MRTQAHKQAYQQQNIRFIRTIAESFQMEREYRRDSDSLAFTESEESLSFEHALKSKWGMDYVSPYKKDDLSINRIAKKPKRPIDSNQMLEIVSLSTPPKKPASKRVSRDARYLQSPSKIERQIHKAADRLKTQARMIYEIQQKQIKNGMSKRQNEQKWADFLLRERRFEQERKNKTMKSIRQNIRQSPARVVTPPRAGPGLTVEDYIRKMKREKAKLQQKVRCLQPNPLRWRSHHMQTSEAKRIRLSEARQAEFLIKMR